MTTDKTIADKDPLQIRAWLKTALEKEQEKYRKCPVNHDMVPGHESAQGWGYVIAGYSLLEQSFKALLHVQGKMAPPIHSLLPLFYLLDDHDRKILREYYVDYRTNIGGKIGAFPFESLDDFLKNLDGDQNNRGNHIGSFDWRYFLTEEKQSQEMPLVSVDYLHEIVYGCIRIIVHVINGRFKPHQYTYSRRMRHKRQAKYSQWLTVRMNSDGWDELGDRLEIIWGPDSLGRYDLCLFQGKKAKYCFSDNPHQFALPVVDKTEEIKNFNVDEGFRSIGITRGSPL